MFHFYTCPTCDKEAERDARDERLGAVSGGAFSLDLATGKISGGGGSTYKYHCNHCGTNFSVDRNSEYKYGNYREWISVNVKKSNPHKPKDI
jgi:DNA-directed RNA polymerase subunit RPC12/RpoP